MRSSIFNVTYYRKTITSIDEKSGEKTYGSPYDETIVAVLAPFEAEAISMAVKDASRAGGDVFVSHIGNGTQDVLSADPVDESSELASLKESLAAMGGENEKLREANQALETDVAAASTKITDLQAQLNQKPQPQPKQPA